MSCHLWLEGMDKTGTCSVLSSLWLLPVPMLNFSIWERKWWKSACRAELSSLVMALLLSELLPRQGMPQSGTRFCLPFSFPFHTRHCCWCPATNKILMTGIGVSQLQWGRHLFSGGARGWRKGAEHKNDHMDLCICMYYVVIRLIEKTWLWQPDTRE